VEFRAFGGCALGVLTLVISAFSTCTLAQDYPNKPIRVVVPFPPGGGMADRMARLIGDKFKDRFGQPVVVDNRPGANANIGAEFVWRAPGDGYTLLLTSEGPVAINKYLYSKLPYEPELFVPVSVVISQPLILVANPKVPASNMRELLAFAKSNPGKLNLASNGNGSNMHLSLEMLKGDANIDITHVAYKGVPPALTDLIGGQVELMFVGLGTVLQQIKAGKVRVLAVAAEKRMSALPEVAAISETIPGFAVTGWFGVVASPKTPAAIAERLSSAIREMVKQPDMQKLFAELSVDGVGGTPEEMAALIKREEARWSKVIRATGIKADQ
jgi:tripartite-type tricarboxylate transporter receptor subunit TctC